MLVHAQRCRRRNHTRRCCSPLGGSKNPNNCQKNAGLPLLRRTLFAGRLNLALFRRISCGEPPGIRGSVGHVLMVPIVLAQNPVVRRWTTIITDVIVFARHHDDRDIFIFAEAVQVEKCANHRGLRLVAANSPGDATH